LPFLVLAIPPRLVCVVATPFWFLVDFHAVPVLELYPPASDPFQQTTRPNWFVTQLPKALGEDAINANTIKKLRIASSYENASRKFWRSSAVD
jgi:hypothetical protein